MYRSLHTPLITNAKLFSQFKLVTFDEHEGSVDQLRWYKTNPELFPTAGGDKTVRIWDGRKMKRYYSAVNAKGRT